ncbi:MAG: monovalent cation/H+ antiporter subunit D family protein [Acidobacteriota bacterium]
MNGGFAGLTAGQVAGLAVLAPCVTAALVALLGKWPNRREAATLITSPLIFALIVVGILPAVRAGERPRLDLVEILPGVSLVFEVEPFGMVFALVASGLWILTSIYAIGYLRGHHETNQTRFFICFALAIFGALGVAFAGNVFTLFVFYELITLSTFPLVTHAGTEAAKRAGRTYLGILMGTSVGFLLLALVWTQYAAGTTAFTPGGVLDGKVDHSLLPWLLALYAFGAAKAALFPFHRWLPAAMVAPTPVSALLHAVAVVKAGVFTITKVVVYIFGTDLLAETAAADWLILVASFTLVAGSVIALYQHNLKRRLAYSTVSQLAYIVLGAALLADHAVIGAGMHLVSHAFGKITLFFCAGAIMVAAHEKEIPRMHGLGRKMPWTFGAFLVASLSLIGIPPFVGVWSKWYLAWGAAEARPLVVGVYMVSSLFAVAYLLPIVARAFFLDPPEDAHHDEVREPLLCVLPPVLTAIGCLLLSVYVDELATFLGAALGGAP